MPTYFIHTFGCQMNYSDTERISSYLNKLGFKKATQTLAQTTPSADLVIFNSCSVRQKGEDRVIGKMRDTARLKPKPLIALTGCMVRRSSTQKTPKDLQDKYIRRFPHLDIAFRIEDLPKLNRLLNEIRDNKKSKKSRKSPGISVTKLQKNGETNITATETQKESQNYFHIPPTYTEKFKAFIPISTGCDKFCTYCIVPYARGREVSRPLKEILGEAKTLVEKGCKEITLLGQTVDSYGLSPIDRKAKLFNYTKIDAKDARKDPPPFVQLLYKLDKLHEKGLKRLRFTSPHPKDVSPELIASYGKLKTLMPHIHLPIQSGDDNCLKRMNRPYTTKRYIEIINALRASRPDIAITTDIIVGFPQETEKEFKNTLELYEKIGFDFCFIAQYSPRKGTYAAQNLPDDVPRAKKLKRWHTLNSLLTKITHEKLKDFIGKEVEVLVEKGENPAATPKAAKNPSIVYTGTSPHNKTVQFMSPRKNLKGTLQPIRIIKAENWVLIGELP
ncbi:MAG: tRNA (N6-isopentenyl adenosine(37)-C2)-methylthiotransferase MiaB [Candidatus Gracilibacteria bacterium]